MRRLALLASAVAVAFAAFARTTGLELFAARPTGEKHPVAAMLRRDLRGIERELDEMRSHLERVRPVRPALARDERVRAVEALEARVEALERSAPAARPVLLTPVALARHALAGTEPRPQDLLATTSVLAARALDEDLEPARRVRALEELNALPLEDARGPELIDSMLDLLATLADEEVERDLIGALRGVRAPRFRTALLDKAMFDGSRHVRGTAADLLAAFRDEPEVAWALEWLAANDVDSEVRAKARRSRWNSERTR